MLPTNLPVIEVTAPTLPDRRYGLYSVGSPIPLERAALAVFQENCPGAINVAPSPCDTATAKTTRSDVWHEGLQPFWAYTLTQCGPFGDGPDGRTFHEDNVEYALEVAFNGLITDPGVTVEAASGIEDLLARAAARVRATIFLPPATALAANDYLKGDGEGLWVKATGQPVTVSPAYTVPAVVTGPVYVRDPNPEVTEAFDHEANQAYQLVEGMYLVGASCSDGVVSFTVA